MIRTYEEIEHIIINLDDELFDKLNEESLGQYCEPTKREQYNSKRRFLRGLKKAGITEEEWWVWAVD